MQHHRVMQEHRLACENIRKWGHRMRGWSIFKVNRDHWERSPPLNTPHGRVSVIRNGARSDSQAECSWES